MPSRRALIRRPSPRLAEGLVTHLERTPVDVDTALGQWTEYTETLREHGWETIEVAPADDAPDSVFVEDTVVMFRNVALITRPGAPPAARRLPPWRRSWPGSAARSTGCGSPVRSTAGTS